MGYISKELLQKAYKELSSLTEDHLQGQTQIVSMLRHLFALDMFCTINDTDQCDLNISENKTKFVHCVRQIVNIYEDYYTTNFYTTIKPLQDCGVGSNFYSAGVVNNSKQNRSRVYEYPTRGQNPLFKVKANVLIRDFDYYKNVSFYLNTNALRQAFAIWLLRNEDINSLTENSIKSALLDNFSEEIIDELIPDNTNIEDFTDGFILSVIKPDLDENDFLDLFDEKQVNNMTESTNSSNYRPYLTAIRTKPFLLLAGISGTGKSRIVRELARACWDKGSEEYKAHKPRNFEMVQVKPNWHDSTDLIGFVSRVSGTAEFVAGDFLRFIVKAWEEPNVPYFLCLDEMNLAPVEQYFAEFLSVIESRKLYADGKIETDPILKPDYDGFNVKDGTPILSNWYNKLIEHLLSGCPVDKHFALKTQFESAGISIPQNLIVIGTVNMDETTFSFSRKVLDRAMTIEMNEVDLYGGLAEKHETIGKIEFKTVVGDAVEGVDVYETNKDVCDIVIEYLKTVNDKLEGTPFKIAYRTRNEFLLYVVNNLPYNKDDNNEELSQEDIINRALDEITCMKILPRIEGDVDKTSGVLNGLEDVLKGRFNEQDSASLKKIKEMKNRLQSGFTSFWS